MTERQILPVPSTADLQTAMRALWPERDILYFRPGQGNGPVLTTEESAQLGAVAMAIARTRGEVLARLEHLAVIVRQADSIPDAVLHLRAAIDVMRGAADDGAERERLQLEALAHGHIVDDVSAAIGAPATADGDD